MAKPRFLTPNLEIMMRCVAGLPRDSGKQKLVPVGRRTKWVEDTLRKRLKWRRGSQLFPGDPIYIWSTPPFQDPRRRRPGFTFSPLPPEVVRLKSTSIRRGVDAYIPPEEFERYVEAFWSNRWEHRWYYGTPLERALANILEQFNLCRPGRSASPQTVMNELRARPRKPEVCRTFLMLSETRWDAINYPELVLAMVMYQAALIAYLGELRNFLSWQERMDIMTRLRHDRVILHSFRAFGSFVIHAILGSLRW